MQNDLFSLIRFLSLEFQFHFAMPYFLFSVCFAVCALVHVFLLLLRLRRAFNIEFLTELFGSFSARFCLLNLRRRFALLFLFNTAAYDSLLLIV